MPSNNSLPPSRSHKSEDIPIMSTIALENKLKKLREQSQTHSQLLTQKLATSQSGQNLLHIGTSLSTLPPDLHSLLTELHPVLSAAEQTEQEQMQALQKLVSSATRIRQRQRRVAHAVECAELYQDLVAAEQCIQMFLSSSMSSSSNSSGDGNKEGAVDEESMQQAQLDLTAGLERAAHITLCLVGELHAATEIVSKLAAGTLNPSSSNGESSSPLPSLKKALEPDSERAQFVSKLAPRIRRLESDTVRTLGHAIERVLKRLQEESSSSSENALLMLGHCMRGLALLGKGKEVELVFARTAIMPLVRSKVSMGRLDEGGLRGECAGLASLLDELVSLIQSTYGTVLRSAETMFCVDDSHDVDLLTAGVWVPIATALMADAGIKMAIFSPGIASILQANYTTLDVFLSQLAQRLLKEDENGSTSSQQEDGLYRPKLSEERIVVAQRRIYAHPKTAEFSKKWNLPIYYQLRFGECCSRLNKAVDQTQREGWIAQVYTGTVADEMKQHGFELSLFMELYDIMLGLWRPDVILRPLTNRFLRGAVQLLGRMISFVGDGMDGTIKFGEQPKEINGSKVNGADSTNGTPQQPQISLPTRSPYCWGESEQDVAAVAWELSILDASIRHDYVNVVCKAIETVDSSDVDRAEIQSLVADVLKDAADQIHPLIDKAWGEQIVKILTEKCSKPLAAVKGVAATYRMTNRPPPTQASPFVVTILRPLKEFAQDFASRTPDRVGARWKHQVVVTIADRYAAAVEELITTVQRTEVALNSRRARRTTSGGMRDGEKVKLQLYLDYMMFSQAVREVGVDPATVIGLSKLNELTSDGESLSKRTGSDNLE